MDHYIFHIPFTEFFSQTRHAFAMGEHSFHLEKGKWTALVGPSGLGKTTFMRYLAFSGQETYKIKEKIASTSPTLIGENTGCLSKDTLSILTPHDRLLPWLRVEQNMGLYDLLKKKALCEKKIHKLLDLMRLPHSIKNAFPHTLSTGMAKRILLARTLYCERPLLFLDEPFSNVDDETKCDILKSLKESSWCETIFFITHDQKEAQFADTIYSLAYDKESNSLHIKPYIKKEKIYHHPKDEKKFYDTREVSQHV